MASFSIMCYFVYIIYSKSIDAYYKGQTKDLSDRLNRHNSGYEKATKAGSPWVLVWYTRKKNRSDAVKLEHKLKNLSKVRTAKFIEKYNTQNLVTIVPDINPCRPCDFDLTQRGS